MLTGAVHVTVLPSAPVAVPVKVVFEVIFGVVTEPLASDVVLPIPLSIENETALVVVHESDDVPPPTGSEVGFAESVQAGAGGVPTTVIVALHVTVPPAPVAVPV